jgi:hypothetical protein
LRSAVRGAITLFTLVLNSISASGHSAVSSASVGSKVAVGRAIIALFISFNHSITTLSIELQEVDWSAISWLKASSVASENSSELTELAGRNGLRGGEDKPIVVLTARRSIARTLVVEDTRGSGENISRIDGGVEVD